MQRRSRVSIALTDDVTEAVNAIKAYYGITSTTEVLRRALSEHAKQIKAAEKDSRAERAKRITYSRRVL